MSFIDTKTCLICNRGKRKHTLYWHRSEEDIWCWCVKCDRSYSIHYYCYLAGISLAEFLKQSFDFEEAKPNEVSKIEWPNTFIPLFDKRAKEGLEYLSSRGIEPDGDMFYDLYRKGIVFPYNYDRVFCGAQIRLINPYVDQDGKTRKIDTLPGTRLGLLFYGWNQTDLLPSIKGIIVCEGAFNAIAINQALNALYGSMLNNPWKAIATSGSGASQHHVEVLKELKDKGMKIVLAFDADSSGLKGLKKFVENNAITHYAMTGDSEKDWNDIGKTMHKKEFAELFLRSIRRV